MRDEINLFNMETKNDTLNIANFTDANWPRFLIMQDVEEGNGLLSLSPFAIAKGIKGLASEPKSVKKTKHGLLIEVYAKAHAECLLKSNVMANIPIRVSVHRSLNSRKGVIRCRELAGITEKNICEELASQNVAYVKRIYVERGQKATNTYILTFQVTELPREIKVGYMNVRVDPFIPGPLRCYKCQEYGHGANQCSRQQKCSRCGENHLNENCQKPAKCVHCEVDHSTSDRKCPRYLKEKEIVRIKTLENISFPEAKRRVEATSKPTFASVLKEQKKMCNQETQTDFYWVTTNKASLDPPPTKPTGSKKTATATTSTATTATSTATAVTSTAEKSPQDKFDVLRNYAMENKPDSPLANLKRTKSINELSGTTSTEIGPSPGSGQSSKHGNKFPLRTDKEKGNKDRDKFIPSHRVNGPSKK